MPSAFRRTGGGLPTGGSTSTLSPSGTSNTASSSSSSSSASLIGYQGVKAWTGGIHLTSVGLKDLDVIVGGGQPLGTCMWIQQDRWCVDLALSLVKYWTAEALSQDQCLMIPVKAENETMLQENESSEFGWDEASPQPQGSTLFPSHQDVTNLLQSLPSNLHWEKKKQREERESSSEQTGAGGLESLEILEEEEEEDEESETDKGLKVAWQYKLSVQRERLGLSNDYPKKASAASAHNTTSNVFCHSYNLSGRMNDQRSIAVDSCVVAVDDTEYLQLSDARRGMSLFLDLSSRIRNTARDGQHKAIRLLFFHTDLAMLTVALPLLLVWIRQESLPVVILICSKPTSDPKICSALSKSADVVMSTEGFASRNEYPPPPEFRHLQGLLTVWKLATVTAATANGGGHFAELTTSKRPAAYIYGFKRDHRKLHIPLLHIPPEDYAEGGGSVGSGVRSGAGRPASDDMQPRKSHASSSTGCASNAAGSVLDF